MRQSAPPLPQKRTICRPRPSSLQKRQRMNSRRRMNPRLLTRAQPPASMEKATLTQLVPSRVQGSLTPCRRR